MDRYRGHIKRQETDNAHALEKDMLQLVPNQNLAFLYVLKKSERLAGALEVVTRLIGKSDPLASRLQNKSLSILEEVVLLPQGSGRDCAQGKEEGLSYEELLYRLRFSITEMLSLLSVARFGGVLSEMNAHILQQEYMQLGSAILDMNTQLGEQVLPEGLLDTDSLLSEYRAEKEEQIEREERESRERPGAKGTTGPFSRIKAAQQSKGHFENRNPRASSHTSEYAPVVKPKSHTSKSQSTDRREAILNVVRRKGRVGIKDITAEITDCSEKTIQRELLSMVAEDVLEKEGERRWSTYTIK